MFAEKLDSSPTTTEGSAAPGASILEGCRTLPALMLPTLGRAEPAEPGLAPGRGFGGGVEVASRAGLGVGDLEGACCCSASSGTAIDDINVLSTKSKELSPTPSKPKVNFSTSAQRISKWNVVGSCRRALAPMLCLPPAEPGRRGFWPSLASPLLSSGSSLVRSMLRRRWAVAWL